MTCRMISKGLLSARELSSPPPFIRPSRARGAKREGIKYEAAFAEALGSRARHGVWFEARDAKGPLWAQVDVLMSHDGRMFVFECKYTWVEDAAKKLKLLYIPLVEAVYGRPTHGIVVCKKLIKGAPPVVGSLSAALEVSLRSIPVLHWRPEWGQALRPTLPKILTPSQTGALA